MTLSNFQKNFTIQLFNREEQSGTQSMALLDQIVKEDSYNKQINEMKISQSISKDFELHDRPMFISSLPRDWIFFCEHEFSGWRLGICETRRKKNSSLLIGHSCLEGNWITLINKFSRFFRATSMRNFFSWWSKSKNVAFVVEIFFARKIKLLRLLGKIIFKVFWLCKIVQITQIKTYIKINSLPTRKFLD